MAYKDTLGVVADQGRGFHLPTAMVLRRDGRSFVASRSHQQSLDWFQIYEKQ